MNTRMNRNRLNIGTYFLRPYACSEAHVKDLADCGIDFVVCMQNDPKTLDLFTKYNVGAIVTGILPGWWGGDGDNAGTMREKNPWSAYEKGAASFKDHPAIWGIDTGDEPSALDFPYYGEVLKFVEKNFPELTQYISSSVSPMVETARLIKRSDPTAKIVFIGPCTSKKLEYRLEKTGGAIDSVMSFEELQAFLDARGIDTTQMEDSELNNASYYGRIFAKSGGIAHGVADVAEAMGVQGVKPIAMNGIAECKAALTRLKFNKATENFFEGMACDGGCLNGPVCITHSPRNIVDVDKYGNEAREKTIFNSVKLLENF